MDTLPQELVDKISRYLESNQLKQTLTMNRKFWVAAERYSGFFNEFSLNEANAQKFLHTFSNHRFRYLRCIRFRTAFPDPGTGGNVHIAPPCRESREELQALDEQFTRQIRLLFSTLKELEEKCSDQQGPGNIQLIIYTPTMSVEHNSFCFHRAYVGWRIHLLAPGELPILRSVRSLRFLDGAPFFPFVEPRVTTRKLDLRVLLDILSRLPNVRTFSCAIGGDEWPSALRDEATVSLWHTHQGPRRDTRHEFAAALQEMSVPTLRVILLNFIEPDDHVEAIDQRVAMPNLTTPALHDPFSSSLRVMSYGLRRMSIFAVVDSTLFLPHDGSTPSWPHLETLCVKFHMTTPSGSWYFNGLQNDGRLRGYELQSGSYPSFEQTVEDEEAHENLEYVDWEETTLAQFRVMPDNELLGEFLAAFAKSTEYMPLLKEAVLWCPLTFYIDDMGGFYENYDASELKQDEVGDMAWGIAYTAPREKAFSEHPGINGARSRQLWWKVGKCRLVADICDVVRRIGCHQHGEDLIEHWDDELYGDGLVDRRIFEQFEWRVFPELGSFGY